MHADDMCSPLCSVQFFYLRVAQTSLRMLLISMDFIKIHRWANIFYIVRWYLAFCRHITLHIFLNEKNYQQNDNIFSHITEYPLLVNHFSSLLLHDTWHFFLDFTSSPLIKWMPIYLPSLLLLIFSHPLHTLPYNIIQLLLQTNPLHSLVEQFL